MTFTASNARILVTAGSPAETIFDTDENMPHIVGSVYLASVEVAFPNVGNTTQYHETITTPETGYYYAAAYSTYSTVEATAQYWYSSYSYDYYFNQITETINYVGATYQVVETYIAAVFSSFVYYVSTDYYQYHLSASEYDATVDLANLPADEDGSYMNIDFIVVLASGSRSVAGTDPVVDQSITTTLPSGVFSFQGSALLEAAGRIDGSSWLRRIISLAFNNTTKKLTLRKMSSVATVASGDIYEVGTNGSAPASIASTFAVNLTVFFGRFKS